MNRRQTTPGSGFTLIELLVVIAIIAILAAILFPVFAKAREKARQISCASNEKQLGLAFMQYTQDNDELTPASNFWGYGWAERIYPYVKSSGVFKCPDDSHQATNTKPTANGWVPISYAININIRQNCNGQNCGGANNSQFQAPASTMLLAEADQTGNGTGHVQNQANFTLDLSTFEALEGQSTWGNSESGVFDCNGNYKTGVGYDNDMYPNTIRHDATTGSLNYLAYDGHVKFLKSSQISDLYYNNPTSVNNMSPTVNGQVVNYTMTLDLN